MHYLIYKITNNINGRIYIGCHRTNTIDDGYMGSGKLIKRAIEKHGNENFTKEILYECSTLDEMFDMESSIVNEEFIRSSETYNMCVGGQGASIIANGKIMHERLKSDPIFRAAFCESIRLLWKDPDYRIKVSEGIKLSWKQHGHPWSGRAHSEETKKRMSESHQGKHDGDKNPQYGKCWIYNLELRECKIIPKDEWKLYNCRGWLKGRKMKF